MVIACIALLASMLLPALAKAKEKASTIFCMNNLRQLGLAMRLYADEYEELLPMAHGSIPWASVAPEPWTKPLLDYYATTNALRCPKLSQHYNQSPFNYFMGSRAAYAEVTNTASVNFNKIRYPVQYILSGDSNYSQFRGDDADPDNYSQETLFEEASPVHNRSVNVLFADGHSKTCRSFNPSEMTYSYRLPGVDYWLTGP